MTRKEALRLWIDGDPTPPTLARHFIRWLYENGYEIRRVDSTDTIGTSWGKIVRDSMGGYGWKRNG